VRVADYGSDGLWLPQSCRCHFQCLIKLSFRGPSSELPVPGLSAESGPRANEVPTDTPYLADQILGLQLLYSM
jgi:hypothetical protein